MPRRGRSSSPMSSAPRRQMTTAAPTRAVAPTRPPVSHPPAPVAPAAPQGPGLMGSMMATAGGVAIGHTLGHAMTGALGMRGGSSEAAPAEAQEQQVASQQTYYTQGQQPQNTSSPCEFEMKQFIECTQQNSNDISLCSGFNEILKECRMRYGPAPAIH